MSANPAVLPPPEDQEIVYPESDGKPMSDNTKQARWITLLYENLETLFASDPNVFVAPDNLWYPVEGRPDIRLAPDVYVVFGRPKGDRGSYLQWREDNQPLTVVFEILSPANDVFEMADKLAFYDEYGVEEYYVYDPDANKLLIYRRGATMLVRQRPVHDYVSPRLGIRFDLSGEELVVRYPDGRPFVRLMEERQRADRLAERLARVLALSEKLLRGEATPDEITELRRLQTES
jgi:Uma2 family endonuclease